MEPNSSSADQAFLAELRRRRAELRESISALEDALAAPAASDRARWAQRVHAALVELAGDFREHVEITEGPDGLYGDLLASSPRVSGAIDSLTRDHVVIRGEVDALVARLQPADAVEDVDGVRALGTTLLGRLVRHRQRGADLVFDAYAFDIGGET
jgi:hypothetical protein